MKEYKTKCVVLSENLDSSGLYFTCRAMDVDYGDDGYAGCDFTGGYKNRCPWRKMRDCESKAAQMVALQKMKQAIYKEAIQAVLTIEDKMVVKLANQVLSEK